MRFVPFGAADGDGGGCGEDDDFCLFLGRDFSLPSSLPSSFEEDSLYETRMVEWVRFIHLTDGDGQTVRVRTGSAADSGSYITVSSETGSFKSAPPLAPSSVTRRLRLANVCLYCNQILSIFKNYSPGMSDFTLSTSMPQNTERNGHTPPDANLWARKSLHPEWTSSCPKQQPKCNI